MKKLLITAGPTREALDDVRFLSNRASGLLGIEIADAACLAGWRVTLVLGPTSLRPSQKAVEVFCVESAQDMYQAVVANFANADALIAAAAVADYRPKKRVLGKLKKQDADLTIELERTVDILAWAGEHRRPEQCLIGFALESDPNPALAEAKLRNKKCDFLVHNTPANFGTSGGGLVRLIDAHGERYRGMPTKPELAKLILALLENQDSR